MSVNLVYFEKTQFNQNLTVKMSIIRISKDTQCCSCYRSWTIKSNAYFSSLTFPITNAFLTLMLILNKANYIKVLGQTFDDIKCYIKHSLFVKMFQP